MSGSAALPSSPSLRNDEVHRQGATHEARPTAPKASHTTPSSSDDHSGSGAQTSVGSSAHSSARVSEEDGHAEAQHTIIRIPAPLPDESTLSRSSEAAVQHRSSKEGGEGSREGVEIVSPMPHNAHTLASSSEEESKIGAAVEERDEATTTATTLTSSTFADKRESLLTMSAAAKVATSLSHDEEDTAAAATAAANDLAASESKDRLDLMSSSVGGHHLSLTEGCVFMKQSCSAREERFYELIRPHQEWLVELAVQHAGQTIRRWRQKARGAMMQDQHSESAVDGPSDALNNTESSHAGGKAKDDTMDGLSRSTPPPPSPLPLPSSSSALRERSSEAHHTASAAETSALTSTTANATSTSTTSVTTSEQQQQQQQQLAAALWWTVMVEEAEWSHVASFEVQRVENHSFASTSVSSLGRSSQASKGNGTTIAAAVGAGGGGNNTIDRTQSAEGSVQGEVAADNAAALSRAATYEQEKTRALRCLAPFLPRFHGVRRFHASELASLCGSCHRGWYMPNPYKHSPSDVPLSDPAVLGGSNNNNNNNDDSTAAAEQSLLLPRPLASTSTLHTIGSATCHTLPPLPSAACSAAATSCHAMREQFDALSPRSVTSLATSPRSVQEEQTASPLSPWSPSQPSHNTHASPTSPTGKQEREVSTRSRLSTAPSGSSGATTTTTGGGGGGVSMPGQSAFASHSSSPPEGHTAQKEKNSNSNSNGNMTRSVSGDGASGSRVYQMIAMEDVCYGFVQPCVLDIKMGSRQYGLHPSPAKKRSKEEKALRTTSAKYGIRLAGFKRWDGGRGRYVMKTKLQCRPLTLVQVKEELSSFMLNSRPMELMFRKQIENLRVAFSTQKIFRFYTSSLLFVYDAAAPLLTGRIVMVDFAYTYEVAELVQDNDPEAEFDYDVGYIKALDTLLSLLA